MPALAGKHITISDGLQGQDEHIETLLSLWENLQLCSLEAAAQPECDLFSFAQSVFYLGVISLSPPVPDTTTPLPLATPRGVEYNRALYPSTMTPSRTEPSVNLGTVDLGAYEYARDEHSTDDTVNDAANDAVLDDLLGRVRNRSSLPLAGGPSSQISKAYDIEEFNKSVSSALKAFDLKHDAKDEDPEDVSISDWPVSSLDTGDEADIWNWAPPKPRITATTNVPPPASTEWSVRPKPWRLPNEQVSVSGSTSVVESAGTRSPLTTPSSVTSSRNQQVSGFTSGLVPSPLSWSVGTGWINAATNAVRSPFTSLLPTPAPAPASTEWSVPPEPRSLPNEQVSVGGSTSAESTATRSPSTTSVISLRKQQASGSTSGYKPSPLSESTGTRRINAATNAVPFTSRLAAPTSSRLTKAFQNSLWDPPKRNETHEEVVKAIQAETSKKAIGMIYLAASRLAHFPEGQVGELNLGIILDEAHRGKGYAREAIQLVVKHAFDVKHCHRIQASLLNLGWSSKDRMVSLLTRLRFGHEGTKRRGFFNPLISEWQDVTTLAILDTDWAMRTFFKPAPKSLWDELFLRHERERDELLRWEETQNRLNRSSSMETLRAVTLGTDRDPSDSDASGTSSSKNKGKKRAIADRRDPYDGSSSDADSDFDDVRFVRRHIEDDDWRSGASSPTPSNASVNSVPRSVTTTGSAASDWDMLDSSSSANSSFGDDDE
ncbi:hypothetical protein DFH07DRAFT_821857 [Mycena maculata]|uniref:N-acetyltransferase domain-containing protein n=1 Tax=Mycena maculata TaxID=230809 RepID=A0AAD7J1Y2_9AGAR|nr:hypothetical protein DFH07DRAFT_821857 [Mycena maculata]